MLFFSFHVYAFLSVSREFLSFQHTALMASGKYSYASGLLSQKLFRTLMTTITACIHAVCGDINIREESVRRICAEVEYQILIRAGKS